MHLFVQSKNIQKLQNKNNLDYISIVTDTFEFRHTDVFLIADYLILIVFFYFSFK